MEQHIRESNLIEGIDDPVEDKQSMKAWKFLEKQEKIDRLVLMELHKRIVKNQTELSPSQKGAYRFVQVWELMEQWLFDLHMNSTHPDPDENQPKQMHKSFEYIHPFVDGNGRTGRMLMWWHELKIGKLPTLLKASERQDYYKWFAQPERNTI
jgi:Fic family protein